MKKMIHTIWVIRAGQRSTAHGLFMERGFIALSKQTMGDLRLLPKKRQAFYEKYMSEHTDEGLSGIRGIGGKFFRFIHEVKEGDVILYPCLLDKKIYCGEVIGKYFYDENDKENEFPHRRKICWKGTFLKSALSELAKRELGAARTFFRFKKNTGEVTRCMTAIKKGRK
jgi:restriction system protein